MSTRNSFIFIALIACAVFAGNYYFAEQKKASEIKTNDPLLRSVLKDWEDDMESTEIDPSRSLGRLRSLVRSNNLDYAGLCNKQNRIIYISSKTIHKGYWTTKVTMYHELGHWAFNLDHGDCGIMNSKDSNTEEYYKKNWDRLLKEYLTECYGKRYQSF